MNSGTKWAIPLLLLVLLLQLWTINRQGALESQLSQLSSEQTALQMQVGHGGPVGGGARDRLRQPPGPEQSWQEAKVDSRGGQSFSATFPIAATPRLQLGSTGFSFSNPHPAPPPEAATEVKPGPGGRCQ